MNESSANFYEQLKRQMNEEQDSREKDLAELQKELDGSRRTFNSVPENRKHEAVQRMKVKLVEIEILERRIEAFKKDPSTRPLPLSEEEDLAIRKRISDMTAEEVLAGK